MAMSLRSLEKSGKLKEWVRPYYLKWFYSRVFPHKYPTYFRSCWSYPIAASSDPREKGDVLFLPAADIHTRTQRTEHFATTLADLGFRCFYLNPHLGREFPHPHPFSDGVRVIEIHPHVYEVHVHLPHEPVYHHRRLSPAENKLIATSLSTIFRKFQTKSLAILSSFPVWLDAATQLQATWKCPLIYDCHDLWKAFPDIDRAIVADEAKFLDVSDSIVFSADALLLSATESTPRLAAKSTVVRNAVDPMWFGVHREDAFPSAVRSVIPPTIGYVGSLSSWFDFDMIEAAASQHSEWRFVLIGRAEVPETAKLKRLPNVQMLGEVPYSELPRYVSGFSVAIIPFRLTPLTCATNPIKLYEYLACGLPIVSSALPEVTSFSDVVYIAWDRKDFVTKLELALAEQAGRGESRRQAVRHETWFDRCLQMEPLLGQTNASCMRELG